MFSVSSLVLERPDAAFHVFCSQIGSPVLKVFHLEIYRQIVQHEAIPLHIHLSLVSQPVVTS